MRSFRAVWLMGGSTVLALLAWTIPANAQGLGSSTGSTMAGGAGLGGGGTGGAGAGGGGSSSGTGLGGSNFLQPASNFLTPTGTTTTTGTGGARNVGGGGGGGATSSATGTGSAFQGISSSNVLGSYYANPLALGMGTSATGGGTGTAKTRFGAPLNNITTTNLSGGTSTSGFNRGGTATTSSSSTYPGSSNIGVRRAPGYSTTLGFDYQPPVMNSVQANVQEIIARSTKLPSKDDMVVAMDGGILVLRGTASSERERRLAEALVRLTPGVRELRNELQVAEGVPAPRPIP